jgi:fungal STAND N-terminal Goodbye domain
MRTPTLLISGSTDKRLYRIPLSPHHFPLANQLPFSIPYFFLTSDMSDQSQSRLQGLFDAALQKYEKQTGSELAKHPLAEQLQNCDSVESVIDVLHEQTQAFSEFRGGDKVMKPLKNTLSVLHKLSAAAKLGQAIGLVRP